MITNTAVIWDIAGAATALPKADWAPDLSFAGQASLRDLQLGWGLAQYRYAPHKQDDREQRLPLLALTETQISTDSSALVLGTHIVREMVNCPANQMTPEGIEAAARAG